MKLSVDNGCLRAKFDDKTSIRLIKEAGFDAFDYTCPALGEDPSKDILSGNYIEKAYELKEYMDKVGIICNQAHAPLDFRHTDKMDLSDEKYLRNIRSIEVASILGAENIIIHALGSVLSSELDYFEYNREYLKSYIPYAQKYQVRISLENLHTMTPDKKTMGIPGLTKPEEHIKWIKSFNTPWFDFCLDTGHCVLAGVEPGDMIRKMGNKMLRSLHIHDNDYVNDLHLLPYSGKINWDIVTSALREINYNGYFTLEAINFYRNVPNDLVADTLKYSEKIGRSLIQKIEG